MKKEFMLVLWILTFCGMGMGGYTIWCLHTNNAGWVDAMKAFLVFVGLQIVWLLLKERKRKHERTFTN